MNNANKSSCSNSVYLSFIKSKFEAEIDADQKENKLKIELPADTLLGKKEALKDAEKQI